MTATKKDAPSTAATGTGAKIIKVHPQNTTEPAKRQAEGKIICFEERRHKCPDNVRALYNELSKSPFGQALIVSVILLGQAKRQREAEDHMEKPGD